MRNQTVAVEGPVNSFLFFPRVHMPQELKRSVKSNPGLVGALVMSSLNECRSLCKGQSLQFFFGLLTRLVEKVYRPELRKLGCPC